MTPQEWSDNPKLAANLAKALKQPIMVQALALLNDMSMAKTLCNSRDNILELAQAGKTLFGYDMGRASVFADLADLSREVKKTPTLTPTYGAKQDDE